MSRICWDTMLFIYLFENHPVFGERVARIRSRMVERGDELCTSALAVGEILAGCHKRNDAILARKFDRYFSSSDITVLPFSIETARRFARIRATMAVGAADAVHLASAAEAGTDVFITNDGTLAKRTVSGISFIVSIDTDLF